MSEILQSQETVKLFEYDYDKPDLTEEDALAHHGVKGQRWGIRKDRRGGGSGGKSKKKRRALIKSKPINKYKTNEDALKAKDLKYINKHKNEFTTKELNQVMSRVEAESKLNNMVKQSSSRGKIKRIIKNPAFKAVATIAIGSLVLAGVSTYNRGQSAVKNKEYRKLMGNPSDAELRNVRRRAMGGAKGYIKDVGKYAGRGTLNTARKQIYNYTDIFEEDYADRKRRKF